MLGFQNGILQCFVGIEQEEAGKTRPVRIEFLDAE